jgi:DtxR family Mn-dependent transcriptional regulator
MELTESLQDYLLEIYIVKNKRTVARLKDIAKRRNVKLPSAVNAVKELTKRGLVTHERYGYIELTAAGIEEAAKLYERHLMLYKFLHNALSLSENIAEKDAHRIEHDLHRETVLKLTKFVEYIEKSQTTGKDRWLEHFHEFENTGKLPPCREKGGKNMRLNELTIGARGKIIRIESSAGKLKTRLLDMGVVPGIIVKVEKVAPMGDPIDILVKGYHLSLRKEEAEKIIVEAI